MVKGCTAPGPIATALLWVRTMGVLEAAKGAAKAGEDEEAVERVRGVPQAGAGEGGECRRNHICTGVERSGSGEEAQTHPGTLGAKKEGPAERGRGGGRSGG